MSLFGHKGQKGSLFMTFNQAVWSILERREVASNSGVSKCFKGIFPVGRHIQVKTPDEQEAARLSGGECMFLAENQEGKRQCNTVQVLW